MPMGGLFALTIKVNNTIPRNFGAISRKSAQLLHLQLLSER